jgi:hypothetical protein
MRSAFQEFSTYVARDRKVVPDVVEYEDVCDPRFCLVPDSVKIRAVFNWCLGVFNDIVGELKRSGVSYSRVALSSKLIAVESKWHMLDGREGSQLNLFMLRASSGRSGRVKPTQTFIGYEDAFCMAKLYPDAPSDFDGMIVCPLTLQHIVQPDCPPHLDPDGMGAYSHFTEKRAANAVVDPFRRLVFLDVKDAVTTVVDLENVRSERAGADADERVVVHGTVKDSIDVLDPFPKPIRKAPPTYIKNNLS